MNFRDKISSLSIKYERAIVLTVVLLGLMLRLYGLSLPLIESHQVRQAQTAMMTRNLYEDHLDILHTRLDFFGNVPGYIIMEFPFMHAITALLYNSFGVHEVLGRLVSIAFSVGAMFLFYGLARQFLSTLGASAALILYTFSPMNIFFSRAFMPESSMMFFMVGSVYFILKWLDKQTLALYLTAILFAALACLTKPTAGLIFVPIITAWFLKYGWHTGKRIDFWIYIVLSGIPTLVWALYAHFFNATIPYLPGGFGGNWLEIITSRGGIWEHWVDPKFYIFVGGSVSVLLLTPLGLIGAMLGVFCAQNTQKVKILYAWLGTMILYFYVLAGANSGHVYYHLPLLPVAAIFFGFTVQWLTNQTEFLKIMFKKKSLLLLTRVLIFIILFSYAVGYYKYFQYMYSVRLPYVLEVSEIIEKHTPKNRFIIDNGSGLLTAVISYYSKSKAHFFTVTPSAIADLESWRAQGATTFVTMETNYDPILVPAQLKHKEFWKYLNETATPIAITEHYQIFDLQRPLPQGEKK